MECLRRVIHELVIYSFEIGDNAKCWKIFNGNISPH